MALHQPLPAKNTLANSFASEGLPSAGAVGARDHEIDGRLWLVDASSTQMAVGARRFSGRRWIAYSLVIAGRSWQLGFQAYDSHGGENQ